jgi:protein SCO1
MMGMRARYLLAAAALSAALAGYYLAHQLDRAGPHLASGTWLPRGKPVGDFRLEDTGGRPFTQRDLAGPALVFFGFTSCPDVCPTQLAKLAQARQRAAVAGLRVLFVSVDPQRDTPAVLGRYLEAFDPTFIGLTAAAPSILALAADFGVAVNRLELPGGDYTMDHSAVVFLLDGARIVAIFTPPLDVAGLSADLRRAAPYLGAGRAP